MPTTRKKVIKTVYKDDDSEGDGDFSDSGSDAKFSAEGESSSGDEFNDSKSQNNPKPTTSKAVRKKPKFAKDLIRKINKQSSDENVDVAPALFSVKDLTEADKLLPSILNLSESGKFQHEKQSTKHNMVRWYMNRFELDLVPRSCVVGTTYI